MHSPICWGLFCASSLPLAYIWSYMLFCGINCTLKKEPPPPPQPSLPEQLLAWDSRYITNLNAYFWDTVEHRRSGSYLAERYTELLAEYQPKRLEFERVLNLQREESIERLLYFQKFLIAFANDPDGRNAGELDDILKKHGDGMTIGFKPDCLIPYPSAEKLLRMYYKAIHLNLKNCVIEVYPQPQPQPPPPPRALEIQRYRDKSRAMAISVISVLAICSLIVFVGLVNMDEEIKRQ